MTRAMDIEEWYIYIEKVDCKERGVNKSGERGPR